MTSKGGNVVELVDGIICYKQMGDQTPEVARRTVQALFILVEGMKSIRLFVDYSQSGKIDEDTIQKGLYAMKNIAFDKVAIYGASGYLRELVSSLAHEAGISSSTFRFVKSREEAFKWLKRSRSN